MSSICIDAGRRNKACGILSRETCQIIINHLDLPNVLHGELVS